MVAQYFQSLLRLLSFSVDSVREDVADTTLGKNAVDGQAVIFDFCGADLAYRNKEIPEDST